MEIIYNTTGTDNSLCSLELLEDRDQFQVVFYGKITGVYPHSQVKNNLANIFRLSEPAIEKLFSGKTMIIKENVDYKTARKYQKAFHTAGAHCDVRPVRDPLIPNQIDDALAGKWLRIPGLQKSTRIIQPGHQSSPRNRDTLQIDKQSLAFRFLFFRMWLFRCLVFVGAGLFWGPQGIFGFFARKIKINDKPIQYCHPWGVVFSAGLTGLLLGLWIHILLSFLYMLNQTLLYVPFLVLHFFILPLPFGFGIMVLIQSLLKYSTLNNESVFHLLFKLSMPGIISFIKRNITKIYVWGLAGMAGCVLMSPVIWMVLFYEWFSRMKVDGVCLRLKIPWKKIILQSLLNPFCFDVLSVRWIRYFFMEVLPNGFRMTHSEK